MLALLVFMQLSPSWAPSGAPTRRDRRKRRRRCKGLSKMDSSYLACFLRLAHCAFIRSDCALRAAADIPPRRFFGAAGAGGATRTANGFFGGRPRRLVPWRASIARLILSRSATRSTTICSVGILRKCYHLVGLPASGGEFHFLTTGAPPAGSRMVSLYFASTEGTQTSSRISVLSAANLKVNLSLTHGLV
jgi:hypothetical protein